MTKARFSVLLNNDNAMSVIKALNKAGYETRFIGGCVRDQYKRYATRDIDLATEAKPKQVMKHLDGLSNLKDIIPTGIDHGTLTLVFNDKEAIEITTLRRDVSTDGRHATVEYTTSWKKDAARRDFTFNAISVDHKGQLYDEFDGVEDLKNGIVRFIGKPKERIKEDYLRILRYFRFQAGYGNGEFDDDVLDVLSEHAEGLDGISNERITYELHRMMSYTNPLRSAEAMEKSRVRNYVVPMNFNIVGLERALESEKILSIDAKANLRLYVLLKKNLMSHINIDQHLVLSKAIKTYWRNIDMALAQYNNGYDLQQAACLVGDLEIAMDAYLVFLSANPTDIDDNSKQAYQDAKSWTIPEFPIDGNDVKERGFEGEKIGDALEKLRVKWVKSDFTMSRQELLSALMAI